MAQKDEAARRHRELLKWRAEVGQLLTPCEKTAVQAAAHGLNNLQTAEQLFRSVNTIKASLRRATIKLKPHAERAGVVSLTRASLAVVCVRAGLYDWVPRPHPWGQELGRMLGRPGRQVALDLLKAGSFEALRDKVDDVSLREFDYKTSLFFSEAGMLPAQDKLVELIVRSGVVTGPQAFAHWRPLVRAAISPRRAEVLVEICKGRTDKEIASETGLSMSTVKTHVARLIELLAPYAALAGVITPLNRTGLAIIALAAGLIHQP